MNISRSCPVRVRRFGIFGTAAFVGLVLASTPVVQAADVVARVDGVDITTDDLDFAATDFAGELERIPEAQHRAVLVDVLVDIFVLARAAEKEELDKTDQFEKRLAFLRARALRNAYFKKRIESEVTEDEMRALYDREIAKLEPEEEIKASHILVATKEEAEAIIAELAGGKDFAELAKEKSIDPTAKSNGGDLDYFTRGRMVKSFEDAAFGLEPGKVSAPVESQFGW
ncbi:MAG: peptidylprolyl isomerase, partial [Hyphomicrobiales bacterium]|nr:peptidylprolyl isomerase [Hyphomicrobiales bacterium]